MRERPILFSGPMVRAILEGRKTQTRRVVKPQPEWVVAGAPLSPKTIHVLKGNDIVAIDGPEGSPEKKFCSRIRCPYGVPGDRLWVRETFCVDPYYRDEFSRETGEIPELWLKADANRDDSGERAGWWFRHRETGREDFVPGEISWKPSIYMPRWASRLTLEVKAVRVERLQEISERDALAEGVDTWRYYWDQKAAAEMFLRGTEAANATKHAGTATRLFYLLWQSINAKRGHGWEANPWVWVVEFERVNP